MTNTYLPKFPDFKLLALVDKVYIQEYLAKFPPYGDYNFASLWSYNTEDDALISMLHENIVIRFRDYITNELFYSFIGTHNVRETITLLFSKAKEENLIPNLQLIPEIVVAGEDLSGEFDIQEDRDSFDYILSVSDLRYLAGSKFHTQKNHVNRFHKLYPHCVTKVIDVQNATVQKEIYGVFSAWKEGRGKTDIETNHELTALTRLMESSQYFRLLAVGIYDEEILIGFAINDIDHPEYAQNHFAKSDPKYKEVYYKMNNAIGEELYKLGYKYLNIENDLGIPGLRYAKEQWNPVQLLKKYTISSRV